MVEREARTDRLGDDQPQRGGRRIESRPALGRQRPTQERAGVHQVDLGGADPELSARRPVELGDLPAGEDQPVPSGDAAGLVHLAERGHRLGRHEVPGQAFRPGDRDQHARRKRHVRMPSDEDMTRTRHHRQRGVVRQASVVAVHEEDAGKLTHVVGHEPLLSTHPCVVKSFLWTYWALRRRRRDDRQVRAGARIHGRRRGLRRVRPKRSRLVLAPDPGPTQPGGRATERGGPGLAARLWTTPCSMPAARADQPPRERGPGRVHGRVHGVQRVQGAAHVGRVRTPTASAAEAKRPGPVRGRDMEPCIEPRHRRNQQKRRSDEERPERKQNGL